MKTKKRTKENSEYWNKRREKMFELHPESKLVENRYRAIVWLLKERYGEVGEIELNRMCELLKDADYLNRGIRWATEDIDREKKDELESEKLKELGY